MGSGLCVDGGLACYQKTGGRESGSTRNNFSEQPSILWSYRTSGADNKFYKNSDSKAESLNFSLQDATQSNCV